MKFRTAMAVVATAGFTLAGAGAMTPAAHAAKKPAHRKVASKKVLRHAFASTPTGSAILHARVYTVEPGLDLTVNDDLALHVTDAGVIDKVHELRLDGQYAGEESVITQPLGLGDLTNAVTQDRPNAQSPIRSTAGLGEGDSTIGSVISQAIAIADGEQDVSGATVTTFEGQAAYAVPIRAVSGAGKNPSEVAVTLFVDKATGAPIAAQYGSGATLWRTMYLKGFERLPDTPDNQSLLAFVQ
jgi:hypothetical protein